MKIRGGTTLKIVEVDKPTGNLICVPTREKPPKWLKRLLNHQNMIYKYSYKENGYIAQTAKYLTLSGLANYMGRSKSYICQQYPKWIKNDIRYSDLNGQILFHKGDIDRMMNRNCQVCT